MKTMKDFKHIMVILIVSIGIIGLLTMPFVQSIQNSHHDITNENKETGFKKFTYQLKKSIQEHIEKMIQIIDKSPISSLIKKEIQTSLIWREISAFLFEPKDGTFYLKIQHAKIVKV